MRDYYDFLTPTQKEALAEEYTQGPVAAFEGVHPGATDKERLAVGAKRFNLKFLRNDPCPMGHWPENYEPRPCIRDRLRTEGYLS